MNLSAFKSSPFAWFLYATVFFVSGAIACTLHIISLAIWPISEAYYRHAAKIIARLWLASK